MKAKGSAGGHNGLGNINEMLETNEYPRLRFGIGDEFSKGRQTDYVLGEWTTKESTELESIIPKASQMILDFGTIGIHRTMTGHNNA